MIEQVKGTRNLFGAESEKYIHIFNAFCDAFWDLLNHQRILTGGECKM